MPLEKRFWVHQYGHKYWRESIVFSGVPIILTTWDFWCWYLPWLLSPVVRAPASWRCCHITLMRPATIQMALRFFIGMSTRENFEPIPVWCTVLGMMSTGTLGEKLPCDLNCVAPILNRWRWSKRSIRTWVALGGHLSLLMGKPTVVLISQKHGGSLSGGMRRCSMSRFLFFGNLILRIPAIHRKGFNLSNNFCIG